VLLFWQLLPSSIIFVGSFGVFLAEHDILAQILPNLVTLFGGLWLQ
jgi:hypothetical protein